MLSVLHIENIAVIERADICFDGGFNVLTGETGAGKSIVIDAISAILGERTYRDVIRTGSDRALVSAVFLGIPKLFWFEENQIEYDPQELLVQRELYTDGKSVCRVNGRPVTASILKRLGAQLINIHGQHDSQQLFDESAHLQYLDLFAHDEVEIASYSEDFSRVQKVRQEIERLSMDEGEKLRLVERLQYEISEIERADPRAGEDEELEARRRVLQNSEKLKDALDAAVQALYGDEQSDGAAGLLKQAERQLSRVSSLDAELDAAHKKVADLSYAAQDAAEELQALRDNLTDSEGELEQLEGRLDTLHRLKRKYGGSLEAVLKYLSDSKTRLDEVEFASDRIEKLKTQLAVLEKEAMDAGLVLRGVRKQAAEKLAARIQTELSQLDMPKIRFTCQFDELPLGPGGLDAARFLMSANVGEALKPLSKVASGGELARIMLAMKNVLAEQDAVPTLIFDEVDAGVSGRAAQKVAEKLSDVARGKQVLCVTHLPQIAAMADTHFIVEKQVRGERTYTEVGKLDRAARREELARITGGTAVTKTMLAGAEELLAAADAYKHGKG
jgi:DNA repair protein RecN (Recombination protein N)